MNDPRIDKLLRGPPQDEIFKHPVRRAFLEHRLREFAQAYELKIRDLPANVVPRSAKIEDLVEEDARNPDRIDLLMQAIAFSISPQMLVMVWLVALGLKVQDLSYRYRRRRESHLEVKLALRYHEDAVLHFVSDEHWDLAVLKLAGISKADEMPVIDDFYPIFIPRRTIAT